MKLLELHVRTLLAAGVFAAMVWGFHAMIFVHAPDVFRSELEDMSFGWYVPLFSCYVVWSERAKIRQSIGHASWAGLLATVPFLLIGFLGVRGLQVRFEILAFAGLLVTVPWAFFGRQTAKAVLFPALFLLFCIPLATFLDVVTVHLRLLASSTAFSVARGLGADIIQKGTMVGAADGSFGIDVADPCSGLRSLFALMALTAAYAYFTQPTWLRRALLFAASVPLAVIGNVMRILTIVLVASCASADFATGFYHDYSGFVVFAVAILLMIAVGEIITRVFARGDPPAPPEAAVATASATRPSRAVPVVAFLAIVPLMFFQAATPEVSVADAPDVGLGEIEGFSSEELEPSEAEETVLPKDTRIEKRRYVAEDGEWMVVSLIVGGTSKSSIHRPELCLPAQGVQMERPRTRKVAGRDWRFINLASKDSPPSRFAYTFFNQEGFETASHVSRIFRDILDRSLFCRIDRWVMVTVHASRQDDEAFAAWLGRLNFNSAKGEK